MARPGNAFLTLALIASTAVVAWTVSTASPAEASVSGPAPARVTANDGRPDQISAAQASAQARATGHPVLATALTTVISQTTANPNGTLTLTQSGVPMRVWQHGGWADLNATLATTADGRVAPLATTNPVFLSGGGDGPLASLYNDGKLLSLTLPVTLPKPVLSGSTATYANVLPDVDLTVTVQTSGAFSNVFIVRTADAAKDPRLARLLTAKSAVSKGLSLSTDAAGNLAVTDAGKHSIFVAPAPLGWDSATTAPVAAGSAVPPFARRVSGAAGPGWRAHQTHLKTTVSAGMIALAAPTGLLSGPSAAFPVFVDPMFSPSFPETGWAGLGAGFPTDNHWDSTVDPIAGITQVGNSGQQEGEGLSLFNLPINMATLRGATIFSAVFGITETHSWSCPTPPAQHNQTVDLYTPSATLNSANATWNSWVGSLGARTASETFALGFSTACPANAIPPYNVLTTVKNDVAAGKATQTFALRADDHTDNFAFKEFKANTANLTVTYDKTPNRPSGLHTSPVTNCAGSTLGDTGVTLFVPVSSPDPGSVSLTTTFTLYRTADAAKTNLLTAANGIASNKFTGASGQSAVSTLPESFFKARAAGAVIGFTWQAQTTDGTLTSAVSATCSFVWDPTRPGAPGVVPDAAPPAGTATCATVGDSTDSVQPVGANCSFTLTPPHGGAISGYSYQVDQQPPASITATGTATLTVPLIRLVNTLTVNAVSAGGNIGSSAIVYFDGTAINPPAKDGDITNDGTPDLIVPGGAGSAFPAGLWFANGHADGTVAADAINIGINGLGINTGTSPTDWNGAQAISGDFCGFGAQDTMAYFPTGTGAGGGDVVCEDGSSDPLHLGSPTTLDTTTAPFQIGVGTFQNVNGVNAGQIANAGNVSNSDDAFPDLFATIDNQMYLFLSHTANGYSNDGGLGLGVCIQDCFQLTGLVTPDGTQDWNSWTVTTVQLASGTAMFLWKPSTGALDLWTGLQLSVDGTTLTTTGSFTIASGWNTGVTNLLLRAADINADGIPDLWVTNTSTGATTAYLPKTLLSSPAIATATTTLTTATHSWQFQDIGANTSGTALASTTDSVGSLNLTGSGPSAVWNTGDIFSPDALLNTNSDGTTVTSGGTGRLVATGPDVAVNKNFTVSARIKPNALGGVIMSQDGVSSSGFNLYPDATTGKWSFCLARTDTTTWNFDCAIGGTVELGTWTQVTASYNAATAIMTLYVNGVDTATATHTPVAGFTGPFQLGDYLTDNVHTAYFSGQIADVQTWNQIAPPAQPQTVGSEFVPLTATRIMDTRNATGGTQGPIAPGAVVPVSIRGIGGIPTTGVTAVALSITATAASNPGFLTAYPSDTPVPVTSNVNFVAGHTVTTSVIVPVGTDGKIDICSCSKNIGSVQILVDPTGYFTTSTGVANESTYVPVSPARILDTRSAIGAPKAKIASGANLAVAIDGSGGIPTTGVTAVAINLTVANPTATGFVVAYPDQTVMPATTNVSFIAGGAPISATAIIPVSQVDGRIQLRNSSGGSIDVLGDVVGYFTTASSGQKYHSLDSTRMLDTRQNGGGGAFTPGQIRSYTQNVVSAVNPTLVINLTTTQQTAAGFLSAYPGNLTAPPNISTVNYASGIDLANLDLVQTSGNVFDIAVNLGASTQAVVDINGYFANY